MFIDTSAFVALAVPDDDHHRAAASFFTSLEGGAPLVTSTDVFDETVTRIRRKASHGAAVAAGRSILASSGVRLVPVEPADREAAWRLFCDRPKVPLSLTDCTNVAIMDRLGLRRIFTFDGDFQALELEVVPRRGSRR